MSSNSPNSPSWRGPWWVRIVLLSLFLTTGGVSGAEPQSRRVPGGVEASPSSVEDLLAIERKVTGAVERMSAATVAVKIGRAQGSGVIVSKEGDILTAAHVAGRPNEEALITLNDGRTLRGITLGVDRNLDAGMMRITEKGEWPVATMAEKNATKLGDWCVAIGHPGGYQPKRGAVVRVGRVVAANKSVVQTDCTLVGGDSGGPLFNLDGEVIGIHSRIGASTNWNFHVPVSAYRDDWERLVKAEEIDRRPARGATTLGVSGDDDAEGVRITQAPDGFPARKAGLAAGDIITRLAGTPVRNFASLAELVRKQKPGDEVTIEFLRDGNARQTRAKLIARE